MGMAQFYGPYKEERDTIPVEDSTFDAFKILLDLLYNKTVSFESLGFELLADLFYLAKKLLLDKLKDSIIQEVSSRKMTPEKLLEAVKLAEDQVHMERFSEAVFKVCAKFVEENIRSVFEIFEKEAPGGGNSLTLHRLMAKANSIQHEPSAPVCENCKHHPCLHGQILTKDNFVIKARICRGYYDDGVIRETVGLINNSDANGSDKIVYEVNGRVPNGEISNFIFKCK